MFEGKLLLIKLKSKMAKRKHINMAWLLFGITILLILSIISPGFFQRAPYYNLLAERLSLPYELKLYGKVISNEEQDYSSYTIYVGGYKAKVENNGNFEMLFLSESKEDIVVILLDDKNNMCYYSKVSFENEKKNLNIRLRRCRNEVSRNYYFGNECKNMS